MEEGRCKFWLPKKNRFCSNRRLSDSLFCGNHNPKSEEQRVTCPLDPSHSVLQENLESHLRRCPFLKQLQSLKQQPFYKKGINGGRDDDVDDVKVNSKDAENFTFSNKELPLPSDDITSNMKRNAVYNMTVPEFSQLMRKIESIHSSISSEIHELYNIPEVCGIWINKGIDRKLPFQEKHVLQQASILGNLADFGILENPVGNIVCPNIAEPLYSNGSSGDKVPAVVEFGAGRGYLTQILADCYGIKKVFLVERKSYKLKADRSLRQTENLTLERLRIDIEDLNLDAVESLRGVPYLAIGKHLCGPATDLTLRCCLPKQSQEDKATHSTCSRYLRGLAIATCCHHLCQWKHYINKRYFLNLGIRKDDFHAITWFTSWAVDADHGSDLSNSLDHGLHPLSICVKKYCGVGAQGVEEIVKNMEAMDRAVLGLMCKEIIDMGRIMWLKEQGLATKLTKYVPSNISPENHLLIAKNRYCL
ncbi:tRNA:m(4)X modification enzyme TRM13 isoform X1 [Telopea speciosissima]|uniref:tRNA:m(4)X modification enzyme TRM13 isoform X1 n=1 Tax=Telopea speciosissima TaxID=54955 RepID=UPI001CC33AD0|nr:tRNA:m(4)X modification enzyme TRM13 isoform X1 [Telopea speciosissima]